MHDVGEEKHLDWICRRYTEEVWASMFPEYRKNVPANEEFLQDVEQHYEGETKSNIIRSHYKSLVQMYSMSGLLFKYWSDPSYKIMFVNYSKKTPDDTCVNWHELIELNSKHTLVQPSQDFVPILFSLGFVCCLILQFLFV